VITIKIATHLEYLINISGVSVQVCRTLKSCIELLFSCHFATL